MRYTLGIVAIAALTACTPEEEPQASITVPTTYEFERNGVSTVSFGGQITRQAMLRELSSTLKAGVDNTLSYDLLEDMYENTNAPFSDPALNTSGKALASKTSASPAHVFDQGTTINWFKALLQEAATTSASGDVAADGTAGIIQNQDGSKRYLVNAQGLEYVQVFEKGLMGAVFMDQMVNNYLTGLKLNVDNDPANGTPYTDMEHHWDEAYGYFSIQQDFSTDPAISQDRGYWGGYMVGLEQEFGLASDLYYSLRRGRAAIVAQDYDERDAEIPTIASAMEEATYLKALGYLNKGAADLNNGDAAAAFHHLSEGVGFIYSLRYVQSENVTPAMSDQWIQDLTSGSGFWSGDIQTRIESVKTEIGTTYNLSQAIIDGSH